VFETHMTRTEDSASIENQTEVENETETNVENLRHIDGVEKATIV